MNRIKRTVSSFLIMVLIIGVFTAVPYTAVETDGFNIVSPVLEKTYQVGDKIPIKIIAKQFYYTYKGTYKTNEPNSLVAEIYQGIGGELVKRVKFTVKETDKGATFLDSFTPKTAYYYNVKVAYRKGDYSTYNDIVKSGTYQIAEYGFTVKGKTNPIKVTPKSKMIKSNTLMKKTQKAKLVTIKKAQGKVSCGIVKKGTNKNIFNKLKINKKGVVTIKKGSFKKGKYKVKILVKADGNATYDSAQKKVTAKLNIK